MTVRHRILLTLLFVSVIFAGALFLVQQDQAEYFRKVVETREREWQQAVQRFLQRQERPAATLVFDLATDLDVVGALEFDRREKLVEALDDRMLKSRGLHAVWIFRPDGTLLYAHALPAAVQQLEGRPLPGVDVASLLARDRQPHFHFELPPAPGEAGPGRFVEVRGALVEGKVANADGSPRVVGSLFAGCLFGRQEVAEMPLLHPADHVELLPVATRVPGETERTLSYSTPVRDWRGREIARLAVWNNSRELADLEALGQQHLLLMVACAFALFAMLFIALSRSILRPLTLIAKVLDEREIAPLAPLVGRSSELGALARLVRDHLQQSAALVLEMNRRIHTQNALRESDEMLRHSQKLEAVGRLAGGVAHDFNNLLTAIIGYAALLRQRLATDPVSREQAELIHQAGEQAAGLTRQLLAFSRKQHLQPRLIDLNAVIRNLQRLLQRIIGEHIEIVTEPGAATGCVRADPGQIEQVVINLGVNARDAMPRGGRLTIRTVDVVHTGEGAELELPAGDYVAIEVSDTGEGMDAETKSRIFEPFFTTKGPGKGTGLGLATVYGIIKQSGGGIVVESERGRGTTFRLYLPREEGTPEAIETAAPRLTSRRSTETVLVVEDEEIVRELVCEVLRAEGYRIVGTDRGSEAVRLVREELKTIDLLISDVVMPEMNGAAVAREIHALVPDARVLFVSGYSENDMADQGLGKLSFQVLQKPFTPVTLTMKVREVLDAPGEVSSGRE
jgi:signal transduction histidine kinase